MRRSLIIVMFLLFAVITDAMDQHPDPYAVSCQMTITLRVPIPADKASGAVVNGTALIDYLKTLDADMNKIPLRLYDSIAQMIDTTPLNEEFSNVLLRLWGINSLILEEKEKAVPELLKGIKDILMEVKEDMNL